MEKKIDSKLQEKKLSLQEYIDKNTVKPYNVETAKNAVILLTSLVGIIIAACLFLVTLKIFEIHEIAGYVSIGLSVLIYIFLFIVPAVKINKNESFFVRNVKYNNYRKALKHNIELRNKLAQSIIDLVANTENTSWYNETKVAKLAIAKQAKNYEDVKEILKDIYNTDVKKVTNKIITDHAVKVGLTTAVSQSGVIDTAFVAFYELDLIKQIVFLYGYRPSDFAMAKIYKGVIVNSLLSYGVGTAASSFWGKVGQASSSIPVVGSLISVLADSVSQGIVNSTLTVIIGFQTKKYLVDEYKLAETLEDLDITKDDLKNEEAILKEVKIEVDKASKNQ